MRKNLFKSFFTLMLVSLISSCVNIEVIDKLFTFYINNQTTFTVSTGVPISSPFEVPTPNVTTNSSTEFSNNNTNANLVKNINLQELKLTITKPTDKTFSFLSAVHLYISTNSSDEIELAYLDNINTTTNTINLTCTGEKLDKYMKADSYKIRTKVTTKETLTQDVTIKADMKFKVTANTF